jgi:putative membrane protein
MREQAQVLLASFGPISAGMGVHILLMNVLAPMAVLWIRGPSAPIGRRLRGLALATAVQLLLLWTWHAPPSLDAAMEQPTLHLVMQFSLTIAAIWFWGALVNAARSCPWRSIAALLVTSKLFCLLGILLTFASRPLYPEMTHHGTVAFDPMADQQLAGLMMLIACPLSYLVAAVVVASRWLLSSDPPVRRHEVIKVA